MTDAPKTIAEMREAAAKVADTLHYPDETKISASIRDAIRALPLPDDAEMVERREAATLAYDSIADPLLSEPCAFKRACFRAGWYAAIAAKRGE